MSGKEFVYNHHLGVPHRPLIPHLEKSIGAPRFDGNLIIHGDNLHALKALLLMYAGRVDCVFIDPPYNTGNVNSPMLREWLDSNPIGIEDGLRLLRELLSESGSLRMTLDDNEVHRTRMLLDEIFGAGNFVATCIWQKRFSPSNDEKYSSSTHDDIIVYVSRPVGPGADA